MQAALIVQWKGPVPGREAQALELFGQINDHYGKLQANGRIAEFDWYLGTFGPSFFIARGELEVLQDIQREPEMLKLIAKSQIVNDEFDYGFYMTGDGIQEPMKAFTETLQELSYL